MILSKLEALCLNAMADDYESFRSIATEMKAEAIVIDDQALASCLGRLVADGFADAYAFDSATGRYRKVDLEDPTHCWFLITGRGVTQLQKDWDTVMKAT